MFRGLLTSFVGHGLLLAWAFLSLHRAPPALPETVMIEATIITPSDLTRLKKGDPDSKKLEAKAKEADTPEVSKKEAKKAKPITAPPPPSPPPPPPPPQEDEIAKQIEKEQAAAKKAAQAKEEAAALQAKIEAEQKAAEQRKKAEAKKKADAKKKAEAKRKAKEKKKRELAKKKERARKKKLAEQKRKAAEAKKKKQFDADKIAALIDKSPEKRGAPRSATEPSKPTDYTGPTAGERRGTDTVLSAREQDLLRAMLKSQLTPCSKMPGGGGGIDTPVVQVQFRLRPDGSLDGEPVPVAPQRSPLYNLAADASIRAVKQCAPFQLPPDKYSAWSSVTWEFDWPVILGLVQR